jgi:hypothetical protein
MLDPSPPLEFGDKLTVADIEQLISCPDDTLVVVWSVQHPGAITSLRSDGILTGDPRFAFAPDPATGKPRPGKRMGYAWIQEQMSKRMADYHYELPIWVLLTRPTHCTNGNDQLLRIEIPKSRLLFSFHTPWMELLPVMARLEKSDGWPEDWPLATYQDVPTNPYVPANADDARKNRYLNGVDGACRTQWDEHVCRSSWERMFDLTLVRHENFLWKLVVQGLVSKILVDDVRDILPMSSAPS